ncbi:MAG: hypothetical protein BMS9Abin26_2065 [Gammaproteobacteria bacterium]|nr:MAG: hypothetical protein BMS9Abin26_2065 [Gammaproteobacteria bacterium]
MKTSISTYIAPANIAVKPLCAAMPIVWLRAHVLDGLEEFISD